MSQTKSNINLPDGKNHENLDQWFGGLIQELQTDHFLLKENIASPETKNFYDAMISGDGASIAAQVRETSTRYFIKNILFDYLREIKTFNKIPLTLALGLSDSKILVWSEINDDDDATENALLLAEARVNSKYQDQGFYINSTIIEKSDNLRTPPHYQNIIISTSKN